MKLEFFENVNEYGDSILSLSHFNSDEVLQLRLLIYRLLKHHQDLKINELEFIEPINCQLTLRVSNTDIGITRSSPDQFDCQLSPDGYLDLINKITPFCSEQNTEHQWLYDLDTPIDFLISPDGKW